MARYEELDFYDQNEADEPKMNNNNLDWD